VGLVRFAAWRFPEGIVTASPTDLTEGLIDHNRFVQSPMPQSIRLAVTLASVKMHADNTSRLIRFGVVSAGMTNISKFATSAR
jgi:hypothetical protein